jgi:hypothetical protein
VMAFTTKRGRPAIFSISTNAQPSGRS